MKIPMNLLLRPVQRCVAGPAKRSDGNDIVGNKVTIFDTKHNPIEDAEIEGFLQIKPLKLRAALDRIGPLNPERLLIFLI